MHVRRMVITGAVAMALVAGGTAAGAAITSGPVDSSGVIHGCYTAQAVKGSHAFVLQDAGSSCPNGTTAIEWNQQGPRGPQGPAGPQGESGWSGEVQITTSPDIPTFISSVQIISQTGPSVLSAAPDNNLFGAVLSGAGLPTNMFPEATPVGNGSPTVSVGPIVSNTSFEIFPSGSVGNGETFTFDYFLPSN